jgi:hypothetical protein
MTSKLDSLKFTEQQDFKEGDSCPNGCNAKLRSTMLAKSIYQRRYSFYLFCPVCHFRYLKKLAITGSGRARNANFTDVEFDKAQEHWFGIAPKTTRRNRFAYAKHTQER